MTTVRVIREFYAIRYAHASFGARPDLDSPEMVSHPLSEGRYVVAECASMADAYIAAHAALGSRLVSGDVEVVRIAEHDPVQVTDDADVFGVLVGAPGSKIITLTITGRDKVQGIPHFATAPATRYHPVNGWVTPQSIEIE